MLAELVLTGLVLLAQELDPLIPKLVPLALEELPTLVPLVHTKLELLVLELEIPTHKLVRLAATVEPPILVLLVRLSLVLLVVELVSPIPKPAVVVLPLLLLTLVILFVPQSNVVSTVFALDLVFCFSLSNGWLTEMLIPMSQPQMVIPSATPTKDLMQEPIMENWMLMTQQTLDPKTCSGVQLALLLMEFTTCVSTLTIPASRSVKPLLTV